jgi:hypothetical protein
MIDITSSSAQSHSIFFYPESEDSTDQFWVCFGGCSSLKRSFRSSSKDHASVWEDAVRFSYIVFSFVCTFCLHVPLISCRKSLPKSFHIFYTRRILHNRSTTTDQQQQTPAAIDNDVTTLPLTAVAIVTLFVSR